MKDGILISGDRSTSLTAMINRPVLVITVTRYYTGTLVTLTDDDIVLEGCCLIYETGGMNEAVTGKMKGRRDYYGPDSLVVLSRAAIVEYVMLPEDALPASTIT